MRIAELIPLAAAIGLAVSSPITSSMGASSGVSDNTQAIPVPASTESRIASLVTADDNDRYTWDFETYSQPNYYGNRQRFNGGGCVNFRCIKVQSYKGLKNKEYIFYDGHDCHGEVMLRTTKKMMSSIPQPFAPCSIRVQDHSNQ
ncbi:hypothetical protein BG004_003231 [Podila humilis]|nr:hypothetical protein BG004_003231 [Podila humilis]